MPDPADDHGIETVQRRIDALSNSVVDVIERTDEVVVNVGALLDRVDTLARSVVACTNSLRDVYARLDRIETELQIDEPGRAS